MIRDARPPLLILLATISLIGTVLLSAAPQHRDRAHHHPEAQKLKNPVPATAASIAAGRELYTANCAECHGEAGLGDGPKAASLKTRPSNLADEKWSHGSTDGEIFTVIRDGTQGGMRRFSDRLKPEQMWHLVNYVRSLGPTPGAP